MQKIDLTGKVFSMLTVLQEIEPLNGKKRYRCLCECGNTTEVSYANLKSGKERQSCGCMRKKWLAESQTTHGMRYTKLYSTWQNLRSRCYNSSVFLSKSKAGISYAERGISVCKEWEDSFKAFQDWAESVGYDEELAKANKLSIDRIDNNGNYEPDNCRWTNQNVQSANTRQLWTSNTSGYRGVRKSRNKFRAYIKNNGLTISLGQYDTIELAAKAYDFYIRYNNLPHTTNSVLTEEEFNKYSTDIALYKPNTLILLSKRIMQLTLTGEIVAEFADAAEASSKTGVDRSSVLKCCRGEQQKSKGFLWKFRD